MSDLDDRVPDPHPILWQVTPPGVRPMPPVGVLSLSAGSTVALTFEATEDGGCRAEYRVGGGRGQRWTCPEAGVWMFGAGTEPYRVGDPA